MPEPNLWNTATCHKIYLQRANYTTDKHIILVDRCCLSVATLVKRVGVIANYILFRSLYKISIVIYEISIGI